MERILYSVKDQVGTITLNYPQQLNGIGGIMLDEFVEAFRELEYNDDVRVIVINGAGKAFSGGGAMDKLKEIGEDQQSGAVTPETFDMRMISEWSRLVRNSWKPVIGSVHGACAGGAIGLAFLCDLVIAAEHTTFREPFINIGICPDLCGTYALTRHVNVKKATELMFLGNKFGAQEALEMGAVNWVVPDDQLEAETAKLCQKLIAKPKNSLKFMKQIINQFCWNDLETELRLEWMANSILTNSTDFREGVDAFVNKRVPEFNK